MSEILGTDITSNIKILKANVPTGAVNKALATMLKEFLTTTGADPKWIDVIDTDGKKYDLKTFAENIVKTNDLSKVFLLQKVCKDSKVVTEEVLPKVHENNSRLSRDDKAEILRITLNLSKKEVKQKDGNIMMGQLPQQQPAQNSVTIDGPGKATPGGEIFLLTSLSPQTAEHLLSIIVNPQGEKTYRDILEGII